VRMSSATCPHRKPQTPAASSLVEALRSGDVQD
jgi:hypothetical protein